MTKPVFKTLSFSVLAFVMAAALPAHELSASGLALAPADRDRGERAIQEVIARGWAYQRGLLDGRLEAKAPASLDTKGAMISPPFPKYAPYRKDLPPTVARWMSANDLEVSPHRSAEHEPSVERF